MIIISVLSKQDDLDLLEELGFEVRYPDQSKAKELFGIPPKQKSNLVFATIVLTHRNVGDILITPIRALQIVNQRYSIYLNPEDKSLARRAYEGLTGRTIEDEKSEHQSRSGGRAKRGNETPHRSGNDIPQSNPPLRLHRPE